MTDQPKQQAKSKAPRVKVADAVSDGKGGFLPIGAEVNAPADTIASLKEKGFVE